MSISSDKPIVVTGSHKVGILQDGPTSIQDLLRIPSNTPYIRRNVAQRHAMALGDVEGTFIRAGHQCGKTLQTQELMDELLKQQVEQYSQEIGSVRLYLEQSIGVRRTVKSLYARLKVIQQFNEVMTGYPRPIQVFFPDALAITLFATNHLKITPGQFRPVVPEDRWVFTGLVKHYMETQQ